MNLDNLITFAVVIVIAIGSTGNLKDFQTWIWRAQAKLIYESRTETWGSPRFFPRESDSAKIERQTSKTKPDQF